MQAVLWSPSESDVVANKAVEPGRPGVPMGAGEIGIRMVHLRRVGICSDDDVTLGPVDPSKQRVRVMDLGYAPGDTGGRMVGRHRDLTEGRFQMCDDSSFFHGSAGKQTRTRRLAPPSGDCRGSPATTRCWHSRTRVIRREYPIHLCSISEHIQRIGVRLLQEKQINA